MKQVTAVFEWTSESMLIEQLEHLKRFLLEGREYYEKFDIDNKMLLQFQQKYQQTRSFKIVSDKEIIVKSNI